MELIYSQTDSLTLIFYAYAAAGFWSKMADSALPSTSSTQDISSSESSESENDETEVTSEEPLAASMLLKLKAPKKSELSRKRKVQSLPPVGKKRASGRHGLKEPKVPPSKRVSEFPGEHLTVSLKRLLCSACRETLSVKQSTVQNHVKSAKHVESKAKLKKRLVRDMNIVTALKKYDQANNPVGQTLPEDQRLYRVKVVKAFMRAGVPIGKLEVLRDILEEKALRSADTRHMLDLIPFILTEERAIIREEIKDR